MYVVHSFDNITPFDFMDPYNLAQLADDTAIISESLESLIKWRQLSHSQKENIKSQI